MTNSVPVDGKHFAALANTCATPVPLGQVGTVRKLNSTWSWNAWAASIRLLERVRDSRNIHTLSKGK